MGSSLLKSLWAYDQGLSQEIDIGLMRSTLFRRSHRDVWKHSSQVVINLISEISPKDVNSGTGELSFEYVTSNSWEALI